MLPSPSLPRILMDVSGVSVTSVDRRELDPDIAREIIGRPASAKRFRRRLLAGLPGWGYR